MFWQTGHVGAPIANPGKDLFKKLGLPDSVSAIILTITPSEASIIACDIATKSGAVRLVFSTGLPARWY